MTMQNELVERLIELIDEWRTRRTDIQLTDQCLSDLRTAIASVLNEQPKIDLEEVEKYLNHNSICGIEQRDEIRAMRNVPQKYRNEAYYQDLYDMESSPMVCTCGLDKILEDLEQFKKTEKWKVKLT